MGALRTKSLAAGLAFAVALAGPAAAQTWRALNAPDQGRTSAEVVWPTGDALAVVCQDDQMTAILTLPDGVEVQASRGLTIDGQARSFGLLPMYGASYSAELRIPEAARLARALLGGGRINLDLAVRAPADLASPDGHPALAAVLEACGQPRRDPRDDRARLRSTLVTYRPSDADARRVLSPERLSSRAHYEMDLTCVVAHGGRLDDCRVERQNHAGEDLARAGRRLASRHRLEADPDTVGRVVQLTVDIFVGGARDADAGPGQRRVSLYVGFL